MDYRYLDKGAVVHEVFGRRMADRLRAGRLRASGTVRQITKQEGKRSRKKTDMQRETDREREMRSSGR